MNNEVSNTFYEVQAEKFYQKKVEVARGVIELGQILKETKDKMTRPEFLKWLKDSRVEFGETTACKYMRVAESFGELDFSHREKLENLSLRVLYTLASAPDDVKENVANSKDKEEAEKKIKEYERQLKEEREAKETVIKNNQELQRQLEKEKNTKKVEYRTNEVIVDPPDYEFIKDRIKELEGKEKSSEYLIDSLTKELDTIRNSVEEKDEQLKQYSELNSKLNSLGIGMDIRDQYLEDTTELSKLVGAMNYFFDEKLAPTKYKRCLKYYRCDNAVVKSLRDIIEKTEDWLTEIKMYLPESNQDNYIEVVNVEVK